VLLPLLGALGAFLNRQVLLIGANKYILINGEF
jgi:hypothetical protein